MVKKKSFWYWMLWIIIILMVLNFFDNQKEKNCDLTFHRYTYDIGCAGACSVKCYDEGFSSVSSSYFEPYLTGEQMDNEYLYKRCECICGGCRK